MDAVTAIGILASALTAVSTLPQLIKLIREKTSEGVSLLMLVILCCGLILWIWYGALKEDWILIVSNGLSLVINVITAVLSIRYKKSSE